MSDKPVIFISHSSKDKTLAALIREQIAVALDISVENIFLTPDSVYTGADWKDAIVEALNKTNYFVILVSENSMESNWVWFEIGYIWSKPKVPIIPLLSSANPQDVKHPLNTLQWKSLGDRGGLRRFFSELCEYFQMGDPNRSNVESILEQANIKIGLSSYSETDINEKLKDYLQHEYKSDRWIMYADLDISLGLPAGSTAKYIKLIADQERWGIENESDNGLRLKKQPVTGFWGKLPNIME